MEHALRRKFTDLNLDTDFFAGFFWPAGDQTMSIMPTDIELMR